MKIRTVAVCLFAILFFSLSANGESQKLKNELALLKAHKGSYTFAVIGDNRSGDNIYNKLVDIIVKQKPLLVMNTGDVIPTPGIVTQWENFKVLSSPIKVPYFIAAGNHDVSKEASEKVWLEQVSFPGNEKYFSFEVGRSLFVVLYGVELKHEKKIEGAQLEWLKKTLDPKKYEHQFVFVHYPLFMQKGDKHYGDSLDKYPEQRDALHKVFVENGVTAVFAGHEHTYRRQAPIDGVNYIITGGGGAPKYSEFNHAMFITVDGANIRGKVYDRDSVLRDEFTIEE